MAKMLQHDIVRIRSGPKIWLSGKMCFLMNGKARIPSYWDPGELFVSSHRIKKAHSGCQSDWPEQWRVIHNTRIRLRTWLLFLLPFCGWMTEHRWRTLSAFLKLLPVNHRMAVSPRFFTTNKTLGPLPTVLEMIYKLGRRTPVLGRVSHSPTSKNGWGWKCFGTVLCYGLVFFLWMVCWLKSQNRRDKVVIAQALAALKQGPLLMCSYLC